MIRVGIDDLVVVLISLIVLTALTTMAITKVAGILRQAKARREIKRNAFRLPKRTCKTYKGEGDPNAQ